MTEETSHARIRGLFALADDLISSTTTTVEAVHKAALGKPLDRIAVALANPAPVATVRSLCELSISTSYEAVRLVSRVVRQTANVVLDAIETDPSVAAEPAPPPSDAPPPAAA